MTVVSTKGKEMEKRGDTLRAAISLPPASEQQCLIYMTVLAEATRERKLAVLRISELSRQAVSRLVCLAERASVPGKDRNRRQVIKRYL